MERVKTLIDRLQQQLSENASPDSLLLTVQMLQAELVSLKKSSPSQPHSRVAVVIPESHEPLAPIQDNTESNQEKVVEILQVDEKEIEEELAQLKKKAASLQSLGHHTNPALHLEFKEDIPTLAHQPYMPKPADEPEELHSAEEEQTGEESLNDKLKSGGIELGDSLKDAPITDLRKAIGINDRFLFINELFRGDEAMYDRSIKTIQGFSNYAEAEFWIRRELKVKIGWPDRDPVVKQFDELIRRRFR